MVARSRHRVKPHALHLLGPYIVFAVPQKQMENPTANTTTPSNPPYNWIGEPKQRGTFGIISLCFSTLIICIWSTLHFNIPAKRYTATRRFFIQVSWMFIALIAPEILRYLAINERITAGFLLRKVLKFHPHLAKPGMFTRMYNWIRGRAESKDVSTQCQVHVMQILIVTEQRRYNPIERTPHPHFGLVHAFYAAMGGFAFYASYDDDTPKSFFEISTNPRCAIDIPKFNTLVYIMKHFPHIVTDIPEEDILDRAASSSLSKALLVFQVAWFCTNCASRLFQHLPLSLLETSTAAHAFCTLLTYFVWWSKPLNVATPTVLREKEAREVYALLKCSDDEYYKALDMARKRAAGDSSMPTGLDGPEKIFLAAGALQHLLPTPERPPRSLSFHSHDRMLVPGAGGNKLPNADFSTSVSMAISPVLYGLVHFLAWNDRFPTPLEQLFWRVSSFVVSCSGLMEIFLVLSGEWLEERYKRAHYLIINMLLVFAFVVPLAHVLASGFLIVESVRQLLFLDNAAYQLPAWSNYWPHFS